MEQHGFDDETLERLYTEAQARGIELADDLSRQRAAGSDTGAYSPHAIAEATSDSLQLFLRDIAQRPLLTATEEVALAKRIERGDGSAPRSG